MPNEHFIRKVEGGAGYTLWLKKERHSWQYNGMDISSQEKRASSWSIVKLTNINFKVVMLASKNLSLYLQCKPSPEANDAGD